MKVYDGTYHKLEFFWKVDPKLDAYIGAAVRVGGWHLGMNNTSSLNHY